MHVISSNYNLASSLSILESLLNPLDSEVMTFTSRKFGSGSSCSEWHTMRGCCQVAGDRNILLWAHKAHGRTLESVGIQEWYGIKMTQNSLLPSWHSLINDKYRP